jgi:hypothetical protein
MGTRIGNGTPLPFRPVAFLLFYLTSAVLVAKGYFLSDGKDMLQASRAPSKVPSPRATEAMFAGGGGPQRSNVAAHRHLAKIILWDEGPASVAKFLSAG